MSNFWIGFICFVIGLFIGANVGLLVIALCMAASRGDRHLEER